MSGGAKGVSAWHVYCLLGGMNVTEEGSGTIFFEIENFKVFLGQ